jgi:hypothetical protein
MEEYIKSPEEIAAVEFRDKVWGELTDAAREVLQISHNTGYAANLVRSYNFVPEEYEEAAEKIRALRLTGRDYELLAEQAALYKGACMSVDATDHETPAGHRVFASDVHYYWKMQFELLTDLLGIEVDDPDFEERTVEQLFYVVPMEALHPPEDFPMEGERGP